jgi:hypothetical protein
MLVFALTYVFCGHVISLHTSVFRDYYTQDWRSRKVSFLISLCPRFEIRPSSIIIKFSEKRLILHVAFMFTAFVKGA